MDVIRNDNISIWLVGQREGEIELGFIVSKIHPIKAEYMTSTLFLFKEWHHKLLFHHFSYINCFLCPFFSQFALGNQKGIQSSFSSMTLNSTEELKGSIITAATMDGGKI